MLRKKEKEMTGEGGSESHDQAFQWGKRSTFPAQADAPTPQT